MTLIAKLPNMVCPQCYAICDDYDGVGILYCERCGYCVHASMSGDPLTCDFCGHEDEEL